MSESCFAELDGNGVVLRVIVITQEMLKTGLWGDPGSWVRTDPDAKEGAGLRKNFAAIGHFYDSKMDAFIPPKDFPSWVLDEQKAVYIAPKALPADADIKAYIWDENKLDWVERKP